MKLVSLLPTTIEKVKTMAKNKKNEKKAPLTEMEKVAHEILTLAKLEEKNADIHIDRNVADDDEDNAGDIVEDLIIGFQQMSAREVEQALRDFDAVIIADHQSTGARTQNGGEWARIISINYDDFHVEWILNRDVKGDKIQLTIQAHKVS